MFLRLFSASPLTARRIRAGRRRVFALTLAWGLATAAPSARADGPPAPAPRTWGGPDDPSDPSPQPVAPPEPKAPSTPAAPLEPEVSTSLVRTNGRVGLRYVVEGVDIRGNTTTLDRVVRRYVPFRAGDALDVDDPELERARFRLLATGFFRDVRLSLRKGSRRGYAILVVTVEERNTIVVNDVWMGISADAEPNGAAKPLTAFGGIDVSENNLGGTGIALGGAVAIAERQLALRSRFADPDFLRSGFSVEGLLLYNNAKDFFGQRDVLVDDPKDKTATDYAVAAYQRFGGLAGIGHDLGGVSTQLFVDYRLETIDARLPAAASHRRGVDIEPLDFYLIRGQSVLSTLRATLLHDTRDQPTLPSKGSHLSLFGEAALVPIGSDYGYAKFVARASRWFPMPLHHVLRLEGFLGAIFGDAPLYERFYVGDFSDLLPDRVLDLNVDRRAAPNFFGTQIAEIRYGSFAAKVAVEYRVPIYRGTRSIYGVDLFASTGVYSVFSERDVRDRARGYTGLRSLPIDLTFNLGLRVDTALGGFTLGSSTLLGFIPVRREAQ